MRQRMILSLTTLLLTTACGSEANTDTPKAVEAAPIDVSTINGVAGSTPKVLRWYGTLTADREAEIAADTNGVITAIYIERGQHVKAGEVIAKVDPRTAILSSNASEAQAAAANAQLEAAEADCRRIDELFAGKAISALQYEKQKAGCAAQAASARAAAASAELASTQLSKNTIRAPFSGIIGKRMVHTGEFVGTASPIATIVSSDPVRVEFAVPEGEIGAAQAKAEVQVRISTWPDERFTGTITYLSPVLRAQTRDRVLEAVIPNPDGKLLPGMFATVEVVQGETPAVLVPSEAVTTLDGVATLFVVSKDHAQQRIVKTGDPVLAADGSRQIPVLSGLTTDELVVINPPAELRDGASVE